MLFIATKMSELSFSQLMEVYQEGNSKNGEELWPELPAGQRILQAEQDFYGYLTQVFFPTTAAVYMILEKNGTYVSALRLEPYQDGILLAALETRPDCRGMGYATELVRRAVAERSGMKIYAHVGKENVASLRVHLKCGFQRIHEYAMYLDGSANQKCCTFLYTG